jgi:phage recombination protein Bet
MNALVKNEVSVLTAMPESALLDVLQSSVYPGASPHSIRLVLDYCKAAGLEPMQKPVHIVPMWDGRAREMRDVVLPGIGLYRTIAARSGCAGVDEPEFGPDVTETIGGQEITFPLWCRVTVRRRLPTGEIAQFTAKELWKENYAAEGGLDRSPAPNAMWTKRPYGQLAKCAEAQALRKAFPEIGAQPVAEEMEGKSIVDDAVHVPTASKPAVSMPRSKTGDRAPMEPPAPTPAAEVTGDETALATPGEVAYLLKKISAKNTTVEGARAAAGLPAGATLEGITKRGFAALKQVLA